MAALPSKFRLCQQGRMAMPMRRNGLHGFRTPVSVALPYFFRIHVEGRNLWRAQAFFSLFLTGFPGGWRSAVGRDAKGSRGTGEIRLEGRAEDEGDAR